MEHPIGARTGRGTAEIDAANKIANGEETPVTAPLPAKIVSALCRIEHWFYPRNGRLFRVDPKKCIRCLKCVKNCPTGAIRIGLNDFMRVNGPYDFTSDPKSATLGWYCRKSYERYFADRRNGQKKEN